MEKYKMSVKPRRSLPAVPLLFSRCPERTAPGGCSLGDKGLIKQVHSMLHHRDSKKKDLKQKNKQITTE